MSNDQSYHAALASRPRQRVLAVLADSDAPLDAAGIAARVELHPTTVRFHLDQLEGAGLVRRQAEHGQRRGRPHLLFTLVPKPSAQAQLIDVLAGAVSAAPGGVAMAVRAGWGWADHVADNETSLIDVLDRLGFGPADDGAGKIWLHSCPFREAAIEHPDVVCSVHRGLIERTVDLAGGDPSTVRLNPFVQPELCNVTVGTRV